MSNTETAFKSAMSGVQTAATDYSTAYTAYVNCVSAGRSGCTEPVPTDLTTAVIGVTSSVTDPSGLVTRTQYNTNKQAMYDTIIENEEKRRSVENIVMGTEYKESKREADAVVYAWILWVMVFLITAAIVFVYM